MRQGPPGLACGCLCVRPSPFIIGPPVNTPGSRGGHRRGLKKEGGVVAVVVGSSCGVIFYTSGAVAQKTDKDRQKGVRGREKKQKQGPEG